MMVVMWLVTTFVVAHTVSWAFDDYNGVDDDEYENYNDNGNGHYICGCKWNDICKHCIWVECIMRIKGRLYWQYKDYNIIIDSKKTDPAFSQ